MERITNILGSMFGTMFILKLLHLTTISWAWVLAPLYTISILWLALVLIPTALLVIMKKKNKKKKGSDD